MHRFHGGVFLSIPYFEFSNEYLFTSRSVPVYCVLCTNKVSMHSYNCDAVKIIHFNVMQNFTAYISSLKMESREWERKRSGWNHCSIVKSTNNNHNLHECFLHFNCISYLLSFISCVCVFLENFSFFFIFA